MCRNPAGLQINKLTDQPTWRGIPLSNGVRLASAFTVAVALAGSSGAQDRAQDAWQDVSDCSDIVEVEMFILEFPESRFAEEARACLAILGSSGADMSFGAGEENRPRAATPEMLEAMLELTLEQRAMVQHGLVSLGHDIGAADGVFGSRTRQAIAGYQQVKGLPTTGFLTPKQSDGLMALGEARESLAWLAAQTLDTPGAYREYLSEFPRGVHAVEAHSRLAGLGQDGPGEAASERERQRFLDVVGREPSAGYVDENGWTDLHYAALLNLPGLVEVLVDAGLGVDHSLKSDGRRLTEALTLRIYPFLNSEVFRRRGHTPLHLAAFGNSVDAFERLVANGASVHTTTKVGRTPLHLAAWKNAVEAVGWLVANGADINATDEYGITPLHAAALGNAREALGWLAANGASIHATNSVGRAPVHFAALGNAVDTLGWLAANGADINATNFKGNTPLHDAAWVNAVDALEWLAASGASIHAANYIDHRPIHLAAEWNAVDALEWLVANGADINAKGILGNTPLHEAANGNAMDALAWLIANGADIDPADEHGNTPLHLAAGKSLQELYDRLVAHGADVTARNDDGETPSEIAERMGIGQ